MNHISKPKIIFFDWDDTISNAKQGIRIALNKTINKHKHLLRSDAVKIVENHEDDPGKEFFSKVKPGTSGEDLVKEMFISNHDEIVQSCIDFDNEYIKNGGFSPVNGILELIEFIDNNEIKIIVISNKNQTMLDYEIDRSQLRPYILKSVGVANHKDQHKKPSTVQFEKALSSLNIEVDPKETWMIGDSELDILAGLNFGSMPFFLGHHDSITKPTVQQGGYHTLADGHIELLEILKKVMSQ